MLKIKLILIISILLLSLSGCSPEENEAVNTRYEYEYRQSGKTTMSGEEYARIMQERRAKRIQVSKSGKEGW